MDHRDRLRSSLAGVGCTACGSVLAADRIRVLAERDELAFVELRCPACRTATLGIVTGAGEDPDDTGARRLDVAPYGEFGPLDEARLAGGRRLGSDDVLAMHAFLAGFTGDLGRLLGDPSRDQAGTSGPG
jgi:phage FluMu protein Com